MIIGVTRRFFNSLLGDGYPDETISLVLDILHDNWSYVVFSTLFSAMGILMKQSLSCLIYYMIIGVRRRFFNSLLGVEYPGETLSLVFDILHDNCSYAPFLQLFSLCWISR